MLGAGISRPTRRMDFQNEMFNTTFPLLARSQHYDIWLGLWNFNHFGTWSEWLEMPDADHMVRIAYIGAGISFRFADEEEKAAGFRGIGQQLRLWVARTSWRFSAGVPSSPAPAANWQQK